MRSTKTVTPLRSSALTPSARAGIRACDHALGDRVVSGQRHLPEPTRRPAAIPRPPAGRPSRPPAPRSRGGRGRRSRACGRRRSATASPAERLAGDRLLVVAAVVRLGERSLGESAREPARPELLLRAPAAVAACPHAAGELAGERRIVDVAVPRGPLDRLAGDLGRHVARRELPLHLGRRLHPHRQRAHDEEPRASPRQRFLDRGPPGVVDLVAFGDLELEQHLGLDPQPGLAVEPERDRPAPRARRRLVVDGVVLDRQSRHGPRLPRRRARSGDEFQRAPPARLLFARRW